MRLHLILAASLLLGAAGCASATQPTVAPAAHPQVVPSSINDHGTAQRYRGNERWTLPVLSERDPNTVVVYASVQGGPSCYQTPVAHLTAETATTVTITVATYAADRPTSPAGATFGCTDELDPPKALTVSLSQPLGTRTLIDGADGQSHPVLDPATVPAITRLPAGYVQRGVGWAQSPSSYARAQRSYADAGQNQLTVTIGSTLNPNQQVVVSDPVIQGHRATVSYSRGFNSDLLIAWTIDAQHSVSVYSMSADSHQHPAPTVGQVIEIAQSVR